LLSAPHIRTVECPFSSAAKNAKGRFCGYQGIDGEPGNGRMPPDCRRLVADNIEDNLLAGVLCQADIQRAEVYFRNVLIVLKNSFSGRGVKITASTRSFIHFRNEGPYKIPDSSAAGFIFACTSELHCASGQYSWRLNFGRF
jgi:hypothetical protein